MKIRPLLRSDIPRVLDICVQVFSGDELFRWLYPYQDRYPHDLRRYQLIRLRTRLVAEGGLAVVAETEPGDDLFDEKPHVLGFGFFVREGTDEAAKRWRPESWFNRLERYLLGWDVWYEMTFLQRAVDRKADAMFTRASEYDFYTVLEDYWLLGLLGVDPKCQRRGIGQMIVQHGLSVANDEKVPVALEASVVGRKLYQKMGFKTIQRSTLVDGVEGLEGGIAMLWEPSKMEGSWVEELDDSSFTLRKS